MVSNSHHDAAVVAVGAASSSGLFYSGELHSEPSHFPDTLLNTQSSSSVPQRSNTQKQEALLDAGKQKQMKQQQQRRNPRSNDAAEKLISSLIDAELNCGLIAFVKYRTFSLARLENIFKLTQLPLLILPSFESCFSCLDPNTHE